MRCIEPHGHMVSRTTDDYQAMVTAGCAAVCEPAFWAGFDRGSVAGFRDYYRQLTEYEPARAVDMLEICGRERIWMNSACDWGVSDPLAVPKTALEMRRRGHSEDFVDAVLYRNPHRFLSQSSKFKISEERTTDKRR